MTWLKQIRARKQFEQHPSRFIALSEASKDTIDDTVEWLNKGYERTVSKMEPLLDDPKYRKRWGWP